MADSAEERVADAVQATAEAEAIQAGAAVAAAEGVVEEKQAQATALTVASAETAAALAAETAAVATVEAQKKIIKNEGDMQWLQQHATQMESFSQSQAAKVSQLETGLGQVSTQISEVLKALLSLTQQKSTTATESQMKETVITPAAEGKKEAEAGQQEAEKNQRKKGKRRWI